MSAVRVADEDGERNDTPRRPYNGARRRQQAAGTRDRIVAAGSDLLLLKPVRDWRGLTVRAVAERAGVNERTVYRYFGSERGLRDAVMQRQEEEAGIDLAGMHLDDIAEMAARIFDHVASYPIEPRPALDPTLAQAQQRQREALLGAIAEHTTGWSGDEQGVAAAMLDVLWSVASYERLVVDWQIDRDRAIRGIAWVIELVEDAVRAGRRPS